MEHCARDLENRGEENCDVTFDAKFCRQGSVYVSGVAQMGRPTTSKCRHVATAVRELIAGCHPEMSERDASGHSNENRSPAGNLNPFFILL